MTKKISVNVTSLLIIYALLVAPLIYTHTCTVYNIIALLVFIACFYIIGAALLIPANINSSLIPLSSAGLSVFIGGLIFSLFIFICTNAVVLTIVLLIVTVAVIFFSRQIIELSSKQSKQSIIAFIFTLLIFVLISSFDIPEQFSANIPLHPTADDQGIDTYFFTSIVTAIRHGSIFSAAYEVNTPINYQVLGFFIPALLSNLLNISSHQALWGLAQPFYKFLAILLCYEVCYFFLKDKVSRSNYLFMLLSVSLPVLLAPLHLVYVFRGVVKYFMLNCMGYLAPNGQITWPGTVTYPVTLALLFFCLLLFSKIDWKEKRISGEKITFTIVISIMILGKIPVYFSFAVFIFSIIIKRIVFDKEKITSYLGYIFCSLLISGVIYVVCYSNHGLLSKTSLRFGITPEIFGSRYKSGKGIVNTFTFIGFILVCYLAWMSIRLLGLAAIVRSKNPRLNELVTGGVAAIIITTILAFFLHVRVMDTKGNFITDGSGNLQQFIRSAFYILTIVSTIGILYLFYSAEFKYKRLLYGVVAFWCCASLISLSYIYNVNLATRSGKCEQCDWYYENYNALKTGKYSNGLIAVNPDVCFYGIMLAASDYGEYWTAMDRSLVNYNSSSKNEYRWDLFKDLLDRPEEKYLTKMKDEGVKYIVATPVDSAKFACISLLFPQHLHKIVGMTWIYQLN